MIARCLAPVCALVLVGLALSGCSTGVEQADRAIFINACAAASDGTQETCGCAYDDLASSGGSSDQLIQETIDELQQGQVPERLIGAIARCSTPN